MEALEHDVIFEILLLLDDIDLEKLCYASNNLHSLCNHAYLWYSKIRQIYPNFPELVLTISEYRALYFKLKSNKWSDIVIYAETNHIDVLKNWIVNQEIYEDFFIQKMRNFIRAIERNDLTVRHILAIEMFRFIYTHRLLLEKEKWSIFKSILFDKLKQLSLTDPELKDIFDIYTEF